VEEDQQENTETTGELQVKRIELSANNNKFPCIEQGEGEF
jgi:hypothetical protein